MLGISLLEVSMAATQTTKGVGRSPGDNRHAYLLVADQDYLAARLLLISNMRISGMQKAAEGIEKLMKLALIIAEKRSTGRDMTSKEMKGYSHNLPDLRKAVEKYGITFDSSWDEFFVELVFCYNARYPENWPDEFPINQRIDLVDVCYSHLRGLVAGAFPDDELQGAKQFGGTFYPMDHEGLRAETKRLGGLNPEEILKANNLCLDKFAGV
jgi:hypothetical protein